VNTTWNTADIWLRRTFNPGALTVQQITNLVFNLFHDEDCEIHINGVLAASAAGYITSYGQLAMNAAGQAALISNASNELAVHCHQTTGGQGIDVGIGAISLVVAPPMVTIPNWPENGIGLTSQYFNDTNLTTSAFIRTDTNVNFAWGSSSPGGSLSGHHYSVRWTGKVQPRYSEGYTFHLTTADGCRLWVNGQLIIDKWHDDIGTDTTGSLNLTGGQQFGLLIEFYNNTNAAGAVLEWDSASQTRQVVPQGVLFPASSPTLTPISNRSLTAGQTLLVTNVATDANVPAQTLTWSLLNPPAGAAINATNGLLAWRPAIAQSPSTNLLTVVVADSGMPTLSATQSFTVVVLQPLAPTFATPAINAGQFQSPITGSVGPDYSVYAATNILGGWQLLFTTNPVAMPFFWSDAAVTNYVRRFYRVLIGP